MTTAMAAVPASFTITGSTTQPTRLEPALLVVGGGVLVWAAQLRFGVAELAWFAYAPWLLVLHRRSSAKWHALLLAAALVTLFLTTGKIVTEEIAWGIAPMFAIPLAVATFAVIALAAAAHRHLGPRWGIYAFPSLAVIAGWIQYEFTEGASWGVLAHTQSDNLPLLQVVAVTGLGGVTFLVALGSSLVAAAAGAGFRTIRRDIFVFALLVVAALVFGNLRLAQPAPGPLLRIAGVVSPITFREFAAARHDLASLRRFDDELFARTERASNLGARAVVWNEAATMARPSEEADLLGRGRELATRRGVLLMMAYGVVQSEAPFRWVNKYVAIRPDGTIADEYLKRHPVPGDGDARGTARARIIPLDGGSITGAICYDYSFPHIARDNAADGAGVALVPASDWRGIDPLHGRMARMNAVSAGLSLVRPVRGATSIATDQYGRVLAASAAGAAGEAVIIAAVPAQRVSTPYARLGEVVPLLALAFCGVVVVRLVRASSRSTEEQ